MGAAGRAPGARDVAAVEEPLAPVTPAPVVLAGRGARDPVLHAKLVDPHAEAVRCVELWNLPGIPRALLGAYRRERELSVAEQEALPVLARGAALRFLLTRLVDFLNVPAGALVRPKDPLEYVRKLRFQQSVGGIRDYGVET